MTGKLKIIRVLGNPKSKKKAKAAKRKTRSKSRATKIGAQRSYVLRVIDSGRRALWFTGSSWSPSRGKAKKYSKDAAAKKMASQHKPNGWIVADAIPA